MPFKYFHTVALLFLFVLSTISFGQNSSESFKVSGTAADAATGKGLISATVSVLDRADNKSLTGGTTDSKGNFTVEKIPERVVRIRFSMVGYQTMMIDSVDLKQTSRLGLIKLVPAAIVMPEVVIKSLKPMIEFQADRQVLNMDRLPGNTGTVTDALKNSGVVDVDPQSNKISVRGQNVKLQMDGHQFEMPSDMLAQMPADLIEQVEVITAPGAKESAEGGTYILNLVSKKNKIDNYSGSVRVNASTRGMSGGGINLNYKAGKLNFFSQFGGTYYEFLASSESERFTYNSKSMYYQKSDGNSGTYGLNGSARVGMDYDFDQNNSMTISASYYKFGFDNTSVGNNIIKDNQYNFQYGYKRDGTTEGNYDNYSFSGFYKKKFAAKGNELTFDLLYTTFANPTDSKMNLDYSNRPGLPQKQNSNNGVDASTFIFKTDYALPFSKSKLEAGYSFTYRDRKNDYKVLDYSYITYAWQDSMGLTNSFKYNENIHALYATYSYKIDKLDIKAGLRSEDLITNGKQVTTQQDFSQNYLSFFPNLNISYQLSDLLQLGFNAFRRVTYPQTYYINPFKQYRGPNSYSAGNPDLKPYYVNSYAINLSQYINAYYFYSTGIYTNATAIEEDSVMFSSYINLNNRKTLGVDLTLPYYNTPMMPFHLPDFINMLNIRFSYISSKQSGQYINEDLSMAENNYTLSTNLGLKLWYDIDANLSFYYRPASETRISTSNGYKDLSLYLSKSIMSNKLKFNIYISDLLNSQQMDSESMGINYHSKFSYIPQKSRSISLGIIYMFNDYKERRERNIDDGRDASGSMAN